MRQNRDFFRIYLFVSILILNLAFCPMVFSQTYTLVSSGTPADSSEILGVQNIKEASSSKKSRKEILSKIPFNSLTPHAQGRVRQVLKNVSMYRRLPVEVVECEKDLYDFMVTHPDTMVNIWEVMDISKMMLQEIKPGLFFLEDQAGTQGKIEYLYQSDDLLLIYVFGTYEGVPFPQKVKGCGLLILQNEQIQGPSGENQMAIRLDAFMQIQNDGVEALVKTFQPLVGKVADTNLNQIVLFLGRLSLTVKENGIGVARLAQNLNRVRPEVRNEFAEVAVRGSNRQIQTASLPMPLQYQTSESVTVSNPRVGTEISEAEMYEE